MSSLEIEALFKACGKGAVREEIQDRGLFAGYGLPFIERKGKQVLSSPFFFLTNEEIGA